MLVHYNIQVRFVAATATVDFPEYTHTAIWCDVPGIRLGSPINRFRSEELIAVVVVYSAG